MKSPQKKAVVYLRRSTDRQEQSIEDQRKVVVAYAEAHAYEIVRTYVDDAISGTITDDRKAFQQMMLDAREPGRAWHYVLVYDVKRFGRIDNDEAGHYRFLLRKAGVEVIYVTENFNGDDSDDLLRPVKQWQARQESKDLSKVTIRGQVSLSEKGVWLGGAPPFGFDLLYSDSTRKPYMIVRFMENGDKEILDSDGHRQRVLRRGESLTVSKKDHATLIASHPDRVAIVRRIFQMYVSGMGFRTIADRLNAEGIPSPRTAEWARIHDGRWSASTIREIVLNPAYAGDLAWNRRTMAKFHRVSNGQAVARSPYSRNRLETNPTDDWIVIRDAHEGLVDRQVFQKAVAIRTQREHLSKPTAFRRGRAKDSPYLLSGVTQCGRCGHSMQGYTITKGKRRKDGQKVKTSYYVCGGYVSKGNSVCERVLYRQDAMDKLVLDEVARRVRAYLSAGGLKVLRDLVRQTLSRPATEGGNGVRQVRERIRQIEAKADELLEMMTPANRDFIDQKLVRMKKEREALEVRVGELQAACEQEIDGNQLAEEITAELRDFDRALSKGDPAERKAFIRGFVREILLSPDSGAGVVRIRKFPLPASAGSGNSSFSMVAGGGFEPPTSGL